MADGFTRNRKFERFIEFFVQAAKPLIVGSPKFKALSPKSVPRALFYAAIMTCEK
jgi:hypothetical protein